MPTFRKNAKDMTAEEKQRFVKCLRALKYERKNEKGTPLYDELVLIHSALMRIFVGKNSSRAVSFAHNTPSFLPWHRYFLLVLERQLQAIDPQCFVPYWDWADPDSTRAVFAPDFLGSFVRGGLRAAPLTDGLLAGQQWGDSEGKPLTRNNGDLETLRKAVEGCYEKSLKLPVSSKSDAAHYVTFARDAEGFHNAGHWWTGGHMNSLTTAVDDPVFWLNHCNTDRLWAMWQDNGGARLYPTTGHPFGNNLDDVMWPWDGGHSRTEAQRLEQRIRDADKWPETVVGTKGVTPGMMLDYRALQFSYDVFRGDLEIDRPVDDEFVRPYEPPRCYRLTVKRAGNYRIFTRGGSDLSMELFGPARCANCFGSPRAHDDNSGDGGMNPSISITLEAGTYFAVVHARHGVVGKYSITAKSYVDQPIALRVGQAFRASISQMWEIDWYAVEIVQAGVYIIETKSNIDTLLVLYGNNPPEGMLAYDDDSGEERNALIKRHFQPGKYHVAVRGYGAEIGPYSVVVRR